MALINIKAKHNAAMHDLTFSEESTIQDLSEKVLEVTGVPISGQKLICCGKQLPKDMTVKLIDVQYSVRKRYPISLNLYLSGWLLYRSWEQDYDSWQKV